MGVLAAGLKDRDQLFGEADEEDQDDRRVGPAHLQTERVTRSAISGRPAPM